MAVEGRTGVTVTDADGASTYVRYPPGGADPDGSRYVGASDQPPSPVTIGSWNFTGGFCTASFDDDGHRLDDGPLDRIAARSTPAGQALLALGLLVAAVAVWAAQKARGPFGAVDRVAVAGRIVLGDRASAVLRGEMLVTKGDVRFESTDGSLAALLPSEMPLVRADPSIEEQGVASGCELQLVLPQTRAPLLGPREGRAHVAEGSFLIELGTPVDHAVALRLARAIAVPGAIAVLLALAGASVFLLML